MSRRRKMFWAIMFVVVNYFIIAAIALKVRSLRQKDFLTGGDGLVSAGAEIGMDFLRALGVVGKEAGKEVLRGMDDATKGK